MTNNFKQRGYTIAYRKDQVNHCPACGKSHWHVGRLSAECCFCACALPLEDGSTGSSVFRVRVA